MLGETQVFGGRRLHSEETGYEKLSLSKKRKEMLLFTSSVPVQFCLTLLSYRV